LYISPPALTNASDATNWPTATDGMPPMITNTWDIRFLELAKLVASWSKDPSTKCGAVIVNPDKTIISVGYNGFARGMDDDERFYNDRELKYPRTIHAEMNAILNANSSVKGCYLYVWPFFTCDRCAVHVIQAGIKSVIYPLHPTDKWERWKEAFARAQYFYDEANVLYYEIAL
jgi:dCMP deaminase